MTTEPAEVQLAHDVARDRCIIRYRLDELADNDPGGVFAVFPDAPPLTYGLLREACRSIGTGLRLAGIRQGDTVALLVGNNQTSVEALVAINYIGAVAVPINPALKGNLLAHVLLNARAAAIIAEPAYIGAILDTDPGRQARIFPTAATPFESNRNVSSPTAIRPEPELNLLELERPLKISDEQSIIFTSGTTGKSKGVLSSYFHSYIAVAPETWPSTKPGDRHLLHMPVYHIGGAFLIWTALRTGSSIAVVPSFKTEMFWPWVRDMKVTVAFLLGVMATFLLKAEPSPDDGDHSLDHVFIVPVGQNAAPFRERFKVDVYTLFNMTEISTPLFSEKNPVKHSVCGRPRDGVEVRLVDDHDQDVLPGAPGELLVRTPSRWAMNHGYNGDEEATATAWRGGWFHTGDVFVRDAEGDFFFVDRLKDAIRRRGENISSYELENEILSHPSVREAAAIGVPSEFSEDEILVCVTAVEGSAVTPEQIVEHLRPRVPGYMIPRYIRVMKELPKTPTQKIQKHILRAENAEPGVWDRLAAKTER